MVSQKTLATHARATISYLVLQIDSDVHQGQLLGANSGQTLQLQDGVQLAANAFVARIVDAAIVHGWVQQIRAVRARFVGADADDAIGF
jgi:hypothetical protein